MRRNPEAGGWLSFLVCMVLAASWSPNAAGADPPPRTPGVWTDAADPSLPTDFQVQGEYVGKNAQGQPVAAQVIALGKGTYQAVLYVGGLPGAGWDGENRSLMSGKGDGPSAVFEPATGDRRYLAGPPDQFSATSKFPPAGHQAYSARLEDGKLTGQGEDGSRFTLEKVGRKSPTLGQAPPDGAIVLFDGQGTDEWTGGRLDEQHGILNTDGHDILTRRKFNNYTMHLEFMLPFRPEARSQGRGNSGFYQVDHYEVQILDSFGLEGKDNECGGIYSKSDPLLNMCLPPLAWQTYDVEFTNAVVDDSGKKLKNAVITLRHNGVVIHDKLEIAGVTGGSRNEPEGTPGPIKLQGHGNPLQYRNIWIVERP